MVENQNKKSQAEMEGSKPLSISEAMYLSGI
jgi:hypothetical protein